MNLHKEILNYLTPGKVELKVLDNKYREYYTGVKLNYITYKLLKAKYRKKDVAEALLDLHTNGKIKALFCPDVKDVVFMSRKISYWNYDIDEEHEKYHKDVQKYAYFLNYLNNYINV